MVQQRSNLFGRVRAGSSGGLHHNARIFQRLRFGVLSQLATNDVRSPEVARKKNRDKNKVKEDQEFEYPHKRATEGAKIMLVTRSMQLQKICSHSAHSLFGERRSFSFVLRSAS